MAKQELNKRQMHPHKRTAQGSGKNARYRNKHKRRQAGRAYRGQGR